jgi:hypothetical protein
MLIPRITVFLFASAIFTANASAQLIHSTVSVVKQVTVADSSNERIAPIKPLSIVASSQSGARAGLVVTNAWPNPLHPSTTLHLEILSDKEAPVIAGIYDLDGTEKATLDLGQLNPGSNELQVAVPDLPSGEYIIRIQQGADAPEIVRINYIK